jgi:hypothetical protein
MIKFIFLFMLLGFLSACSAAKAGKFAASAPVKKMAFELPFPEDLVYQATTDPKIIVGKKKIEPAIYEIGGFETETGKKLWQLPFQGEVVGQTEKQILVYEEKASTLHFINPSDGNITRKVSPAPNPLTSKNSLEMTMAFTDEFYLTTKALYQSVWKNNAKVEDESFQIGTTAKNWTSDEKLWFVPPVRQIVASRYRPIIFGDKVLIINEEESIAGGQTYQIVALKTGAETFRGNTEGKFFFLGKNYLIERTEKFVRRIEPFTGKEMWKVDGEFKNASASVMTDQITIAAPHSDRTRTLRVVDAETGKMLKQFDLPDLQDTILNVVFVTKDNQTLLNFDSEVFKSIERESYNYWVGYDPDTKKTLWRTAFEIKSVSSLFPFLNEKLRITPD